MCTAMISFLRAIFFCHTFFCVTPLSKAYLTYSDQTMTCGSTDCLIRIFSLRSQQNSISRYRSKSVKISQQLFYSVCVWDAILDPQGGNKEQKEREDMSLCGPLFFGVLLFIKNKDLVPPFLFSVKRLSLKVSCLILVTIFQRNNGYGQRYLRECLFLKE